MKKKDVIFVTVQFILFGLFAVTGQKSLVGSIWSSVGLWISIIGFLIICISLLQLNKNLSPFPSPKAGSELVTSGLYSMVRHPIYLGIIVMFGGYSLYTGSWVRLLITIVLVFLFHYKSEYEENLLIDKFDEYRDYTKSTNKIFPFL